MKLTHFALILTLGLLGLTGWFAWNEHSSAKSVRNKLDLYERHGQPDPVVQAQEDQVLLEQMRKNNKTPAPALPEPTALPAPAALPSVAAVPNPAPAHVTPPPLAASSHISAASLDAAPPPLTQQQRMVQSAPAIGKVSEYQQQYGFVVVTAGANRRLEKGMMFALRHDGFIVGRIKISEVDDNSAVGDLDGKSVPEGVTIEAGDDIIQDVPTVQ